MNKEDTLFFISIFYYSRNNSYRSSQMIKKYIYVIAFNITLAIVKLLDFPGFHDNILNSLNIEMEQIHTI